MAFRMRCLLLILFTGLAGLSICPAVAEDEDSPSSVYLVFDPETGEFSEVSDTKRKRKHVTTQDAIREGTEGLDLGATDTNANQSEGSNAGGIIALALFVFACASAYWFRRRRPQVAK